MQSILTQIILIENIETLPKVLANNTASSVGESVGDVDESVEVVIGETVSRDGDIGSGVHGGAESEGARGE